VGSSISSWLENNWVGVLGLVLGVWIPLALRSPPAKLRYWTASDVGAYFSGATYTKLNLRNVGDRAITVDQWRVPLSVECPEGITEVQVTGVSSHDIEVSVKSTPTEPNQAILEISRLDTSDEVAFEIRHGKARKPPTIKGEIRGAPESLVPGLTVAQRLYTMPFVVMLLTFYYISLSSIAWLAESRLNISGILRGTVFVLASPLADIIGSPLLRRSVQQKHPIRFTVLFLMISIGGAICGVAALVIAWLAGYQLWYPQFAVYLALAFLLVRIITRTPFSSSGGVVSRENYQGSPALVTFFGGITGTAFAACVAMDATVSTLIWVGLIAATVFAISRMNRQSAGQRLSVALGNPRRQLLSPSAGEPSIPVSAPPVSDKNIRVRRWHRNN
jgi:hypothetical protein